MAGPRRGTCASKPTDGSRRWPRSGTARASAEASISPWSRLGDLICYGLGNPGGLLKVMQSSNAALARIAVAAALIAALGVAGCGRKAGLDPPPAAAVFQPTAEAQAAVAPGGDPRKPAAAPGPRESF